MPVVAAPGHKGVVQAFGQFIERHGFARIGINGGVFVGNRQLHAIVLPHIQTGQRPGVGVGMNGKGDVEILRTTRHAGRAGQIVLHQDAPDHAHLMGLRPGSAGQIGHQAVKGDPAPAWRLAGWQRPVAVETRRVISAQGERYIDQLGNPILCRLAHRDAVDRQGGLVDHLIAIKGQDGDGATAVERDQGGAAATVLHREDVTAQRTVAQFGLGKVVDDHAVRRERDRPANSFARFVTVALAQVEKARRRPPLLIDQVALHRQLVPLLGQDHIAADADAQIRTLLSERNGCLRGGGQR